jgi:hypothetical protein
VKKTGLNWEEFLERSNGLNNEGKKLRNVKA